MLVLSCLQIGFLSFYDHKVAAIFYNAKIAFVIESKHVHSYHFHGFPGIVRNKYFFHSVGLAENQGM